MQSLYYTMLGLATFVGCIVTNHSWEPGMLFTWHLPGAWECGRKHRTCALELGLCIGVSSPALPMALAATYI